MAKNHQGRLLGPSHQWLLGDAPGEGRYVATLANLDSQLATWFPEPA